MVDTLRAPEQRVTTRPREQSRARYPDRTGFIERPGGRVAYEVYGSGDPPIVFVPPWQIVHSRIWKAQIPDFARRHRVVAWDNLGNGHSDRPLDPLVHTTRARTANLGAVMDAAEVPAAVLVGLSSASGPMVVLASEHPERVLGLVFVCPAAPIGDPGRFAEIVFEERLDDRSPLGEGEHPLLAPRLPRVPGVLLQRGLSGGTLHETGRGRCRLGIGNRPGEPGGDQAGAADGRSRHLDTDVCVDPRARAGHPGHRRAPEPPHAGRRARTAIPRARLELIDGGGHMVNARDPIRVNLLIRDFIRTLRGRSANARPGT